MPEFSSAARPSTRGVDITWSALITLQAGRFWEYQGQIVVLLAGLWALALLWPARRIGRAEVYVLALCATALPFGLLFRNAAYFHDLNLLPLVPGATLAAVGGLGLLARFKLRRHAVGVWLAAVLMAVHAVVGIRSAAEFERHEALDLASGVARMPFFLRDELPAEAVLVADPSASYSFTSGRKSHAGSAAIAPHLNYLSRASVHYVTDLDQLALTVREAAANGRPVALVQVQGNARAPLKLPTGMVARRWLFGPASVSLLRPAPAAPGATPAARTIGM